MADVPSTVLGLTGATIGIWGLMAPPVHEVRASEASDVMVRDVRHAEITAGTLTVLGGLVASSALSSPWPALVAVGITGFMCWQLEQGLAVPGDG
jgi:hypothetical protein